MGEWLDTPSSASMHNRENGSHRPRPFDVPSLPRKTKQ